MTRETTTYIGFGFKFTVYINLCSVDVYYTATFHSMVTVYVFYVAFAYVGCISYLDDFKQSVLMAFGATL